MRSSGSGWSGACASTAVGRLSAGQRKRVALSVLVARRPRLWLLDEPHAALDAEARGELDSIVKEAVAAGATVLLASHETEASIAIARRVVAMGGGRVVADTAVERCRESSRIGRGPDHAGGPHVA